MEMELAELTEDTPRLGLSKLEHNQGQERIEHINSVLRAICSINQLIVREKDRDKLLNGICECLMDTHCCYDAWIALLDESGALVTTAEAGLGKDFLPMLERLKRGKVSECAQIALNQPDIVIITDPFSFCVDCPLSALYNGGGAITVRLEHDGKVYGLFSASIPRDLLTDKEEQALFEELASDIAFAVCSIRVDEERKQAEEKKKRLEVQLQRTQNMEAIGTLAGGVAHDLNNILSGIVTYPELLLMQVPEESPLRKPILTIQKSGQRAVSTVQDLMTLTGRGVCATELVNLNSIVSRHLISTEHGRLKGFHPDVKIQTDLQADLLPILGSSVHLSKAVVNLVSNAAEAMNDGGEISISTQNRYVDGPIRGYDDVEEGDYVALSVSDTGVGMSQEDIERVFEPFYTKNVMGRGGAGLGMAVVWGTVKDHKGYIDIESAKGKGTTFTIYFPATRKQLPKDQSPISIEDCMGKGESIVVVDDVEQQREIAFRLLETLGYCVTTVSSGEEAVDYLKDNKADLLVLDMIMEPGIDGLETYKRVLKCHPRQKAIIVSGFSEIQRVREAQKLGAGAYVKKPYLLEKIGMAVKEELDREI